MQQYIFKRSAIHNLAVTNCRVKFKKDEISEGLVVPRDILDKSDIMPWEQIIVTKITGSNWINRIKTFVIPGPNNGTVEARGSLASFLTKGDLTCLITTTIINEKELIEYKKDKFPIFDLGFDPLTNFNNLTKSRLDIEVCTSKEKDVTKYDSIKRLRKSPRFYLFSLILGLKINKTHPDCLQGSAELPKDIMVKASLNRYQSVSVYNSSCGGVADTYAVPMPKGVVMTTGAMAKFAKKGEKVNVATFVLSNKSIKPKTVYTDGAGLI